MCSVLLLKCLHLIHILHFVFIIETLLKFKIVIPKLTTLIIYDLISILYINLRLEGSCVSFLKKQLLKDIYTSSSDVRRVILPISSVAIFSSFLWFWLILSKFFFIWTTKVIFSRLVKPFFANWLTSFFTKIINTFLHVNILIYL